MRDDTMTFEQRLDKLQANIQKWYDQGKTPPEPLPQTTDRASLRAWLAKQEGRLSRIHLALKKVAAAPDDTTFPSPFTEPLDRDRE